ncbi:hypothetical protein MCUN1_003200 [Malassezia cuniculi]|uniref:Ima1 N-terminal domain-containing protein n=1 Tax=Malassezia cuniculi TaxID=948313 RepID=A0AAF0ET42_9BASI|nr:hypothetical protein MCUN1_003200 [Malassezia cuniculi]
MRIWGPRTHACHFCGESSVLAPPYGARPAQVSGTYRVSAGTPERWFCSACECWNLVGKQGEILDAWDRPMWDESVNDTPRHHTATPQKILFCNTCITNQTLVANMLAEYLPDENDPRYAERERSFNAYKRSLEQRYPLACPQCLPKIEEHLADVDAHVRHQLLGAWLQKNALVKSGAADAQAAQFLADVRNWKLRRVLWTLSTAAGLGLAATLALGRRDNMLTAALALGCVPIRWDPTWRSLAALAARSVPATAHGVFAWRLIQFVLWAVRVALVGAVLGLDDTHTTRVAGAAALIFYVLLAAAAFVPLRVTTSAVHKKRESIPPAVSVRSAPLAQLSLDGGAPIAEPFDTLFERTAPADEMDIDDTTADTRDTSRDISLGPQRFWAPEQPSGLEDMFGRALRLNTPQSSGGWAQSAYSVAFPAFLSAGAAAIVVAVAALTVALAAGSAAVLTTETDLWSNLLGGIVGALR